MNRIKAQLTQFPTQSNYKYFNYLIDGIFLGNILCEIDFENPYKENYKELVPTLLGMATEIEEKIVLKRILPKPNEKSMCPILMCDSDRDFACSLIIAEIENLGDKIVWNRIGREISREYILEKNFLEKIGEEVKWLDGVKPFIFDIKEYKEMLLEFEKYRIAWENSCRIISEIEDNKLMKYQIYYFLLKNLEIY